MTYTKAHAFKSLQPTAKWVIRDGVLDWLSDDITQPTEQEITDEIARLQADYDAQEYARNRKGEYPDIGDQLDDLFKAGAFQRK